MRFLILSFLAISLSGCALMREKEIQAAYQARLEREKQEREAYEAFVAESARRRQNVKKLEEGQTPEAVEALIGPFGFTEMKGGKLIRQYVAGGFPMKLTYSKNKLVGWEVDQATLDRLNAEAQAAQDREERAKQAEADREQSRRNAVIQYMGATAPKRVQSNCTQMRGVGGAVYTQCY